MTRTASIRAQSVLQAVSASPALLSGNPRLDEKFLGAGVCQIFSDVSRDVGLGSVGATLEWTVASSNDPIASSPNLYAYCGDNPVIYVDPLGLCARGSCQTRVVFGGVPNKAQLVLHFLSGQTGTLSIDLHGVTWSGGNGLIDKLRPYVNMPLLQLYAIALMPGGDYAKYTVDRVSLTVDFTGVVYQSARLCGSNCVPLLTISLVV